MATQPKNDNPYDLGEGGLALWSQYADAYELDASDTSLLLSACRCVDRVLAHHPQLADQSLGRDAAS